MSVTGITVTAHCNGGFHEPLTMRFVQDRLLKSEIKSKLQTYGWRITADGSTYCREHGPKR